MAQRTQIVLIDDLDGTEIKDGEAQSITFTWAGVDYRIDLSKANADKLEKTIRPYLEKAQRVGRRKSRAFSPSSPSSPGARSTPRRYAPGPHPPALSYLTAAVCPPTSSRGTRMLAISKALDVMRFRLAAARPGTLLPHQERLRHNAVENSFAGPAPSADDIAHSSHRDPLSATPRTPLDREAAPSARPSEPVRVRRETGSVIGSEDAYWTSGASRLALRRSKPW